MARTPRWVKDLVAQVAKDNGRAYWPEIVWRERVRGSARYNWDEAKQRMVTAYGPIPERSSGSTYPPGYASRFPYGQIAITAGTDKTDQRLVLLHELGHWLNLPKERHGPNFWRTAYRLYRDYGVPMKYAYERESSSLKRAARADKRKVVA